MSLGQDVGAYGGRTLLHKFTETYVPRAHMPLVCACILACGVRMRFPPVHIEMEILFNLAGANSRS